MNRSISRSNQLYKRAKALMPGGTQLLSKRPEMFAPDQWPAYYQRANGIEIEDMDGNTFLDMCYMGIGSCTLGYADPDVNEQVIASISNGSMSTLNTPLELKLADILLDIHSWADCVKYARSGGEAMAIATRLGRAASGKDKVLFSGYHGWHDWYLSSNIGPSDALGEWHLLPGLRPMGVPKSLEGTAIPFQYNNIDQFRQIISANHGEIGVVIVETVRNIIPDLKFFEEIKSVCKSLGIVFILDEITSGFRLNMGGAHLKYGIEPDVAVFGKTMSNGFPMSAIVGKREVLECAQQTFVSSLNWTECVGPAAAIATIEKMNSINIFEHTSDLGIRMQDIWTEAAKSHGVDITITGPIPQLSLFSFNGNKSLETKTYYIQEMLNCGYLTTTAFYPSWAHSEKHLNEFEKTVGDIFAKISLLQKTNDIDSAINGPICHTGFNRL